MYAAGRKIGDVVESAHVVKKCMEYPNVLVKSYFFNYISELLHTRDASRKLRRWGVRYTCPISYFIFLSEQKKFLDSVQKLLPPPSPSQGGYDRSNRNVVRARSYQKITI